ncbi:MAG: methyltransferase domain-containing protein [Rhodocyclaceae bacterium]|nr:methyltransferase domain-containing protein [Rhodocyclaceae bacterium]
MSAAHLDRTNAGCLCCGEPALQRETAVISGFLAERAWQGPPTLTQLVTCPRCSFRFFARGLGDDEADNLYHGYRNPDYLSQRQRWEPFYTDRLHQAVLAWSQSSVRIDDLRATLNQAGLPNRWRYALDHGGSGGHLLQAIHAERKVVFDPSGYPTLAGVEVARDATRIPGNCDLLLSCQVLEHISDPFAYLRALADVCSPDAWLYIEVPDETWASHCLPGRLRDRWLGWLVRQRRLLILADFYSTGFRTQRGFVPPYGFVSLREHLNFFSAAALDTLLQRVGLRCVAAGINGAGQRYAIARTANSGTATT